MSDWSSFEDDQGLMEAWRSYLEEADDRSTAHKSLKKRSTGAGGALRKMGNWASGTKPKKRTYRRDPNISARKARERAAAEAPTVAPPGGGTPTVAPRGSPTAPTVDPAEAPTVVPTVAPPGGGTPTVAPRGSPTAPTADPTPAPRRRRAPPPDELDMEMDETKRQGDLTESEIGRWKQLSGIKKRAINEKTGSKTTNKTPGKRVHS